MIKYRYKNAGNEGRFRCIFFTCFVFIFHIAQINFKIQMCIRDSSGTCPSVISEHSLCTYRSPKSTTSVRSPLTVSTRRSPMPARKSLIAFPASLNLSPIELHSLSVSYTHLWLINKRAGVLGCWESENILVIKNT